MKLVIVYEEGDKIGTDVLGVTRSIEALMSLPIGSEIQDGSGDCFRKYPNGWRITDLTEDQSPIDNTTFGTYIRSLTVTHVGLGEVEYGIMYLDPDTEMVEVDWGFEENPTKEIEEDDYRHFIDGKLVAVYRVYSRPLIRNTLLADYLVLAHG